MNTFSSSLRLLLLPLFAWPVMAFAVGTDFFPQSVASGDPTPDSVILWTRLVDGDTASDRVVNLVVTETGTLADVGTTTELTGGNLFTGGALTAAAANDGCVKVRVTGLPADARLYYQFTYDDGGTPRRSAIGRTRTAPAPGTDREISFAVFNCGDYSGRYYNTLKHLNEEDAATLDFVLHVGDYIYETNADPSFQTVDPARLISFEDNAGTIDFGPFQAASSLDNYRQLYRTYREDPHLMRAHELFPWLVIWDDHEYSDDNFGATATYFDGKADEEDVDRKRRAEQAWLEFMPCDLGLNPVGNALDIQTSGLYPNLFIYRNLGFGSHLDVFLTDNRTHRPDHLVDEDAFPGAIAMTEAETAATVEAVNGAGSFALVRDQFDPYFNINDAVYNTPVSTLGNLTIKQALTSIVTGAAAAELATLPAGQTPATTAAAYAADRVDGNLSGPWTNQLFAAAGFPEPFDATALGAMDRGISHFLMGKTANFSDFGSRYQLVDATFQIYAGFLYEAFVLSGGLAGKDQAFYDAAQVAWLQAQLGASAAVGTTWRVIASSSPFTPIKLNLGDLPDGIALPDQGTVTGDLVGNITVPQPIPDAFLVEFLINADEIAGFPSFRHGMVSTFAAVDAVVVSGDIHASMLGKNLAPGGEAVIDFTASSQSSSVFRRAFASALDSIEQIIAPGYQAAFSDPSITFRFNGRDAFLDRIDEVVVHNSPELEYVNTETQGYVVVKASADRLVGEFREIDIANVSIDHTPLPEGGIDSLFTRKPYTVTKSGGDLVCEAGPVVTALGKRTDIKVGDRIILRLPTVQGKHYRIAGNLGLQATGWINIPDGDILAVNGAASSGNLITGTGEVVGVVFRIPPAFSGATAAFFRAEEVTP